MSSAAAPKPGAQYGRPLWDRAAQARAQRSASAPLRCTERHGAPLVLLDPPLLLLGQTAAAAAAPAPSQSAATGRGRAGGGAVARAREGGGGAGRARRGPEGGRAGGGVGVGAAGGGGAPLRLERALPLLGLDPVVEGNHLWRQRSDCVAADPCRRPTTDARNAGVGGGEGAGEARAAVGAEAAREAGSGISHLWVSAHAAGVEGEEPSGEGDEWV